MPTVDVIKCCLDSIRNISDDIKDAIVYLDAGSSESFQFLGAFPFSRAWGRYLFVAWRTCHRLIRLNRRRFLDRVLCINVALIFFTIHGLIRPVISAHKKLLAGKNEGGSEDGEEFGKQVSKC